MATQYDGGLAASAALASALAARGLENEDGRLIGNDAVLAEAVANILNGGVPSGAELTAGAGITAGVGTICETAVVREGGLIISRFLVDLTGLSAAAAGDVIGAAAGGAAYLGRITAAVNGTILGGRLVCLEAPAGGDADIDLYSATAATAVYNDAISGVAGQVQAINTGTLSLGTVGNVIADTITADDYLYLVSVGATAAAYTAGRFMLELYGVPV